MDALRKARVGLQNDQWGRDYTEAIGQSARHEAELWPMDQLAAFTMVHALIYGGAVAMVRIGTAGPPFRDKEREANATALSVLPRPFSATVDLDQANDPGDGTLTWDEPIQVEQATGLIDKHPDGSTAPIVVRYKIQPGSMPLEIGSTLPSRTYEHLAWGSGVARWPYGHSVIHLFISPGPGLADRLGVPSNGRQF